LIPLAATAVPWALTPGDGLALTVSLANGCKEGRDIRIIFDAVGQPSRLIFDVVDTSPFNDNCPAKNNPDQADADGHGVGDACDPGPNARGDAKTDTDGDGVGEACDNCALPNHNQADTNHNGIGDVCEIPPVGNNCGPCPCDPPTPAALNCWLQNLNTTFFAAPSRDVDPKPQARGAPTAVAVRRALKRGRFLEADTTGHVPGGRVKRDMRRVRRQLKNFDKREAKARAQAKISQPMHDRLTITAAKAMDVLNR